MKIKLIFTGIFLVFLSFGQLHAYDKKPGRESSDHLFFKSGEWPLPVKVAPFPVSDIIGGWDMGPDKPIMVISEPIAYPGGHFVDVKLIDRVNKAVIGHGPGRLIDDILVADDLRMGGVVLYLQMASLVPPKNSIEDKNNETMVYVYVVDKTNHARRAQFRIKKLLFSE